MSSRAYRLVRGWNPISAVAVIVIAVGAVQLFAGAIQVGVTVDEPFHQHRTAAWLDNGWYVPSYWQVDGEPDPATSLSTPYVYGPATALVGHAANVLLGNEPLNGVSASPGAFDVRHLTVAMIALLCVAAVGAGVRFLTGSRAAGLWAAAGLLAVPRFTGHAFFNIKDIPAAAGYTLITVALLFALYEEPGRAPSRARRFAIAATVAAGFAIAAGTRLSLLLPLLTVPASYAVLRLGQWRLGGVRRSRGTDLAVGAGVLLGIAVVAAIYPNVAATPLKLVVESISDSAEYGSSGATLTAGSFLSGHPPIWYLPVWFGGTYPLLLGVLVAVGAWTGIGALARMRGSLWSSRELGLILVLLQAILIPLAVIVNDSVIYNGIRQHLYVLPALAILAGVGAGWVLRRARGSESSSAAWPVAVALLSLALIMPMTAQTVLFPYNYTYVNPVAAIGGVNDRWETDYWWASVPEALSHVPHGVELRCSSYLERSNADTGSEVDLHECGGERFGAADAERGKDVIAGAPTSPPAVWALGRKREGNRPPPYCTETDNVTRWLWGETVTMSYVLRCDPSRVPPLDSD